MCMSIKFQLKKHFKKADSTEYKMLRKNTRTGDY